MDHVANPAAEMNSPLKFTTSNYETLTGVVVTDPFADPNSVSFVGGDTNTDGKLDLTETWTYSAKHTVTQGEIGRATNREKTKKAIGFLINTAKLARMDQDDHNAT